MVKKCHRCHAHIWTGLDDHVAATPATVDPTPLTVIGEALAIINGRATYAVDPPSRRNARTITRRDPAHIGAPDKAGATLHAAHVCYTPIPTAWAAPAPAPTTSRTTDDSKELMF